MYGRIILVGAMVLGISSTAHAESASDLFSLYDVPGVISSEQALSKLKSIEDETMSLSQEVNGKIIKENAYNDFTLTYTTFLANVDKELKIVQADLKQTEELMIASQDASLDEILSLDVLYRSLERTYADLLDERELLSQQFSNVNAVKVTSSELNKLANAEHELDKQKEVYNKIKSEEDIGEIKGRHPVSNKMFVTSPYGYRPNATSGVGLEFHHGLDFRASTGTDILAKYNGKVIKTATGPINGNYIMVDHGNNIQTLYAHLETIDVKIGDKVKQYDKIATAGSTGRSTGPHLHFGLYINGESVDPKRVMVD